MRTGVQTQVPPSAGLKPCHILFAFVVCFGSVWRGMARIGRKFFLNQGRWLPIVSWKVGLLIQLVRYWSAAGWGTQEAGTVFNIHMF